MNRSIDIRITTLITTLMLCLAAHAYSHKYRVWLTDKDTCTYTLQEPEKYLSDQSIARRNRMGIPIDIRDIPVSNTYLSLLKEKGCDIVTTSRWMNTVVVAVNDTTIIDELASLPCVERVQCVWKNKPDNIATGKFQSKKGIVSDITTTILNNTTYGHAQRQIEMLNLDSLHKQGFMGEGMSIAVLDAGFYDAENLSYIDKENIAGSYDFAHASQKCNYKYETHGTEVLSCMAANTPGTYVGSAPEAQYWLFVTEDVDTEYPIEEDFWLSAAERADSIGVDIINTSLAYTTFDDNEMNYTLSQLDGKTSFISQGAGIAAQKGMLVVTAAGNEYNKSWVKIGFPADAIGTITVGSVNLDGKHSSFSSCGYTSDGRIKPDVMAMGSNAYLITAGNKLKCASGTSYSAPIMCGALACLWQSHPEWSVEQLITNVCRSASQYNHPDELYGYGIPNIYAAYHGSSNIDGVKQNKHIYLRNKTLHIPDIYRGGTLYIYDNTGRCLISHTIDANNESIQLDNLSVGFYIVVLSHNQQQTTQRIIISQ